MRLVRVLPCVLLSFYAAVTPAQQTAATAPSAEATDAPLPDIPVLMREVEANQHKSEDLRKNYIYHSEQELEALKGNGDTKNTTKTDYEVFWLNGVQVSRKLAVDGKPLSPDEVKKENERIDKQVAKIRARQEKAQAEGKPPAGHGDFILPIARYLELGTFSNPRREILNGRPTILVDFAGDPNAKTKDAFEGMVKDIAGTVYVDEQDRVIQHFDAHFVKGFKLAGGMLISIGEGLNFTLRNKKINDEVWLQESVDGNGHVRALLFFAVDGNFHLRNTDYRKFKATATVLPGFTPLPPGADPKD